MSIPKTTSTEGLDHYLGGKCLFHSRGETWRDLKAWIVAQPPEGDTSTLPSVSESFLGWTISGEVDFQEREYKRPGSLIGSGKCLSFARRAALLMPSAGKQ
jgi:hypothetical protein